MTGTFTPAAGNRFVCATCFVSRKAHDFTTLACPEPWRPSTLDEAKRELGRAELSNDAARIFVARGDVQRLERKP